MFFKFCATLAFPSTFHFPAARSCPLSWISNSSFLPLCSTTRKVTHRSVQSVLLSLLSRSSSAKSSVLSIFPHEALASNTCASTRPAGFITSSIYSASNNARVLCRFPKRESCARPPTLEEVLNLINGLDGQYEMELQVRVGPVYARAQVLVAPLSMSFTDTHSRSEGTASTTSSVSSAPSSTNLSDTSSTRMYSSQLRTGPPRRHGKSPATGFEPLYLQKLRQDNERRLRCKSPSLTAAAST